MLTKLLTFDGRGTLFKLSASVGHLYAGTAQLYGLQLDPKAIDAAFRDQWPILCREHPNFGAQTGKISSQGWWSLMVERVFRAAGGDQVVSNRQLVSTIATHLFKQFSTASCWKVNDGADVLAALSNLRKNQPSIKLGIVSNTDERLETILYQLGLRHYFDFVIASAVVKVEKPDREIFELAAQKAGVDKLEEAMHVGDNVQLDYEAARAAGFRALLLGHSSDGADPNDIITKLTEIKDKL